MKPYANYKDSGVEWIEEIPEEWEIKPFRHSFIMRTGISITKAEFVENGVPCLNYGDIHTKYNFDLDINRDTLKNAPVELLSIKGNAILQENDFVFCDTSEDLDGCGNCVYIENINECNIFSGSHTILARPIEKFNSRFIAYLFSINEWRSSIRSVVYGVKVFSITQTILKSTNLLIPPLKTQEKIVAYLDEKTTAIDQLISDKEKLIALLKEERQAIISEAVTKGLDTNASMKDSGVEWIGDIPEGWEVRKIKYLCNIKRGASPRPIDEQKYFDADGERYWVRISDVSNSVKYLKECEEKLSPLGINASVKIDEDDFFVSICATVGKPCISRVKACIHDGFVLFDGLPKKLNNYMFYLFDNGLLFAGLGKLGTQLNLNSDTIKNIFIPIHKDVEQIVDYLDQKTTRIDSIISATSKQIILLKEYRQAIISEVVTGKVEVI